jgi:hypothetical protein
MKPLAILLMVLAINVAAQENSLKRTIRWGANKTIKGNIDENGESTPDREYLSFEDASYSDYSTLLPYYCELIKLDDYYTSKNIIISDQVYKQIEDADIQNIKFLKNIPAELTWETAIRHLNRKPLIQLSFIPLKKNPVTGKIERLESFVIKPGKSESVIEIHSKSKSLKSHSENSILASGEWYKIRIPASGIYKLTYKELAGMGMSNLSDLRIYGNGGSQLPFMNNESRPDDLLENAIYMEKGSDGIFNSGDYILFYGEGPVKWEYNAGNNLFIHSIHDYAIASYYYLTTSLGQGKKIETTAGITDPATHNVTTFNDHKYHERNIFNLVGSGRRWFGAKIENAAFDTAFVFPDIDLTVPVRLKVKVASRAASQRVITVRSNNNVIDQIAIDGLKMTNFTGTFAKLNSDNIISFTAEGESVDINIYYDKKAQSDEGWLDYIILNARRMIRLHDVPLFFRDIESVGKGNIAQFNISNAGSSTIVWDITDIHNICRVSTALNGTTSSFRRLADTLREYVAFNSTGTFLTPVIDNETLAVENQNLHAVGPHNMIIVTHPDFLAEAEELAEFHRTVDNLSVYVTTSDRIYNEFSSGQPDVSAIRDFVKMIYDRSYNSSDSLRYLLLFGDGSYNNFSSSPGNPNHILTYQSEYSMGFSGSYVTDDFFGFLDDDEGGSDDMKEYYMDIGVGRLTVKTREEAQGVLNKIKNYNTGENMTDWRNVLCFMGDDGEDGNGITHMNHANKLADTIRKYHPEYTVKKLLLDAYQQVTTSTGPRYPDVHNAIIDNFNSGMLIFNYNGHGSENGITKEIVLQINDIKGLKNKNRLPLLITATCEFSRFDNLSDEEGEISERTSAGEEALLNPEGGAIALFSTTRVVFAERNFELNQEFYNHVFNRDHNGNKYRLGDIVKMCKNAKENEENKLNFVLLGDPALKLAYPEYKIITDSINDISVSEELDTLKAFSRIKVSGHVAYIDSTFKDNFNGFVYPSVFDKPQNITTLGNDNIEKFTFEVQENILYKGKATVSDGKFSFSFIVPKDISYNIGKGKICYYAEDSVIDANGYFNRMFVGGTSDISVYDNNGPDIELYLNNDKFKKGGITDKNPVIYAVINDENGINTVGNGIGHDIIGVLDENISELIVLNDYYHADVDKYNSGTVIYQMNDLTGGSHSLRVKVWDIFNNSAEQTIEFIVRESDDIILERVYNYPNPVTDYTIFQFEHNKPYNKLKVTVDIFDLSGRLIFTISNEEQSAGYRSESIYWDGKNMNGEKLSKGIYPFRVRVETDDGRVAEKFEKLLIMN